MCFSKYLTLLATVIISSVTYAQTEPDLFDGFSHASKAGLLLSGKKIGYSSALIADIDGDPSKHEIAIAGADGTLYVISSAGSIIWSQQSANANCGKASGRILASPAVADLDADGKPEVLFSYGAIGGSCDGGVVAYDGASGAIKWSFSTIAWAKKRKFKENFHGVISTPAISDVDGDGKMEVAFGALDRNIYLLDHKGRVMFYYNAADTVFSSLTFFDVDGDGRQELIAGTDISKNKHLKPATPNGGYVLAIKTKRAPKKSPRVSFRDSKYVVWYTAFDQAIQSSPVIADVDAESPGSEIVVGSGCFFPQNSKNKSGKWIKVIRASDGMVLRTLNTTACFNSSPAIGDIDDDGQLEIVATVNGASAVGGDGNGKVVAWKATSAQPIWEFVPSTNGHNYGLAGTFTSPVIADIDGNGSLEVLSSNWSAVHIINGKDGEALSCQGNSCSESEVILSTGILTVSTPAVGDLDQDGILEVVVGGGAKLSNKAALYVWTNLNSFIASSLGTHPAFACPWPMHRGNTQRSGVFKQ